MSDSSTVQYGLPDKSTWVVEGDHKLKGSVHIVPSALETIVVNTRKSKRKTRIYVSSGNSRGQIYGECGEAFI